MEASRNQKKHNPARLSNPAAALVARWRAAFRIRSAKSADQALRNRAQKNRDGTVCKQQQSQPGKITASFAEVQQALARKNRRVRVDTEYYAIETYSWRRAARFSRPISFPASFIRKDKDGKFSVDGVDFAPNEEPTETQLPGFRSSPRETHGGRTSGAHRPAARASIPASIPGLHPGPPSRALHPGPPSGPPSGPGGVIFSGFLPGEQVPGVPPRNRRRRQKKAGFESRWRSSDPADPPS